MYSTMTIKESKYIKFPKNMLHNTHIKKLSWQLGDGVEKLLFKHKSQ